MPLPSNANRVVVRFRWLNSRTGKGEPKTVTFDPVPLSGSTAPNVTDLAEFAWIKTQQETVTPNADTGYAAVALLANDDPDLTAFGGWRVTPKDEPPFVIAVSVDSPTVTVDQAMKTAIPDLVLGAQVQAMWLTEAALVDTIPPPPPTAWLTAGQTVSTIASGIDEHDQDGAAHPDIRALVGSGGGGASKLSELDDVDTTGAAPGGAYALSLVSEGQYALTRAAMSVNGVDPDTDGDIVVSKLNIGLDEVDNTADLDKPVSVPVADALAAQRAARLAPVVSQGLSGETFSRMVASGSFAPTSGDQRAALVGLAKGDVVTNLYVHVTVVGTGVTLAKLGLFRADGVLLASTADLSTQMTSSTGPKGGALTAPYTVPTTASYYIGLVTVGGTSATILRGASGITGFTPNGVGSGVPASVAATGKTDIGNQTLTSSGTAPWFGWS